jgi:hypothetical protein
MTRRLKLALVALVFVSAAARAGAATPYVIHSFTLDGGTMVQPVGITNAGEVVGTGVFEGVQQGFTWQGGNASHFAMPGATATYAWDASDAGDVVGYYADDNGAMKGFVYSGGAFSSFSAPAASDTYYRGISPDGRYITGFYVDDRGYHGFVQDRASGAMVRAIGAPDSLTMPQGINAQGQVAGSEVELDADGNFVADYAFINNTDGSEQHFDFLSYRRTLFRDITVDGRVVGWVDDSSNLPPEGGLLREIGFVGRPGDVWMLDAGLDFSTVATGINNAGVVVGSISNASDGSYVQGFYATPVPEPATWVLSLAGLLGIRAVRRRYV